MFFAVCRKNRYYVQLIKADSLVSAGAIARERYGARYDTVFKNQRLARNYCIGGNKIN